MTISDILDGEPVQIATGFKFTEGPVWHPDDVLFFSDIPAHRIFKLMPDGTSEVYRDPSGGANGLTFDTQDDSLHANTTAAAFRAWKPMALLVSLRDNYGGKRLNSPNDVVVNRMAASISPIHSTVSPQTRNANLIFRASTALPRMGRFHCL